MEGAGSDACDRRARSAPASSRPSSTLVLDQASKLWLLFVFDIGRRGAVKVTPFFDLVLAWNIGISFGWFQNDSPAGAAILLAVKAVAVVAAGDLDGAVADPARDDRRSA